MKRDDVVYVQYMMDAMTKIETYLQGVDQQTFSEHTIIQDAVIRQIAVIGKAAGKVSRLLRQIYTDVPWHQLATLRIKLLEDYFSVDVQAVWLTAINELPVLKEKLSEVLEEFK